MMERIAIIGGGLMGHGLALVFAAGGHDVTITDPMPEVRGTVKERIGSTLKSLGTELYRRLNASPFCQVSPRPWRKPTSSSRRHPRSCR